MKTFITILSIFALLSCKSAKEAKIESVEANTTETAALEGRWVWVSSSFASRAMKENKISTPESRGYTIVLEFTSDKIIIIKNGKEAARVPYSLQTITADVPILEVEIPQDDFPFYISSGPFRISDNELFISGSYNDAGEDQTYKREK